MELGQQQEVYPFSHQLCMAPGIQFIEKRENNGHLKGAHA
jgi:hypothetical protein